MKYVIALFLLVTSLNICASEGEPSRSRYTLDPVTARDVVNKSLGIRDFELRRERSGLRPAVYFFAGGAVATFGAWVTPSHPMAGALIATAGTATGARLIQALYQYCNRNRKVYYLGG